MSRAPVASGSFFAPVGAMKSGRGGNPCRDVSSSGSVGPGIDYRIRGLSAWDAGRETPLLCGCPVLLILPNESSLGLATDVPKVRKKFFCWMDELSGLLTLYGIERRAFAGLCRLEAPRAASFRSRVLSGRNGAFVVTLCREERDVMTSCESAVPRTIRAGERESSTAAAVSFRAPEGFVSLTAVMRVQLRSISPALSSAHATKPVPDSAAAAIPGIAAATVKTKRNNTVNKGVRIFGTF